MARLPDERDALVELTKKYTDAEIAAMCGCTETWVWKTRHKFDPPVPSHLTQGTTRGRGNYADYLPWRVRKEHAMHYLAKMLRLYARSETGGVLSAQDARRLDLWRMAMDDLHVPRYGYHGPVVVTYDPDDVEGFYVVPARRDDARYIRRPKAEAA